MAFTSINRINNKLHDFVVRLSEIAETYKEDNQEQYADGLRILLNNYDTQDIFLLISFLADERKLKRTKAINLLNETIIEPLLNKQNIFQNIIINTMLLGYIEDKEIIQYLTSKNIEFKPNAVKYNVKKLMIQHNVTSRSSLLFSLMRRKNEAVKPSIKGNI